MVGDANQPARMATQGHFALIALGSNAASSDILPLEAVKSAIAALESQLATKIRCSRLYRSPAFPPGAGPDFVNAACAVRVAEPVAARGEDLLVRLHRIEAAAGRQRDGRWTPRVLDLDLIAWEDRIAPSADIVRHWMELPLSRQATEAPDRLILPHPRLQDRAFVLKPLADVAPGWRHPVLGRSVAEMLDALPAEASREVVLIPED